MTRSNTQPPMQVDDQESAEVATITDRALLEQFAEMAVMIPAEIAGGTEDILRKVLSAKTWDQVDEPWEATDVSDILGKHLQVRSVSRRPSTFKGGLGIFLIIKLYDARARKEYVKATGSVAIVGQFAALYAMRATAITIEWCRAERPSESGYYPQHIKVIDASTPTQPSDTQE